MDTELDELPLYALDLFNQNAEEQVDSDCVSSADDDDSETADIGCNCQCTTLLFDESHQQIIPKFCANCGVELPFTN